jgi:predicted kinase
MLVGVPGSGKSTFVDSQIDNEADRDESIFIASTDNLIEYYAKSSWRTYNEVFKERIKEAELAMYRDVMDAVAAGRNIIWDQTNLTRKTRAKKLVLIPDFYEKIAVVFPTPDEAELKRRLDSRPGKTIPAHIVKSMIDTMERPEKDEGFDTIMDFEDHMLYV